MKGWTTVQVRKGVLEQVARCIEWDRTIRSTSQFVDLAIREKIERYEVAG